MFHADIGCHNNIFLKHVYIFIILFRDIPHLNSLVPITIHAFCQFLVKSPHFDSTYLSFSNFHSFLPLIKFKKLKYLASFIRVRHLKIEPIKIQLIMSHVLSMTSGSTRLSLKRLCYQVLSLLTQVFDFTSNVYSDIMSICQELQ